MHLLALALALALAADPQAPALAVESYTLPNGLKVALHRDPSVPRVIVNVAYHVGSKDERAGRTGFAHFFEHMMFRGTKNVPDYDIPLQAAGTQTNAFTSEDVTVYLESVPSEYLERALYMEAERLAFLPSALNQDKFDTEREVVKNERRQHYENMPYGMAEEAILASVFPKGHPYSWSVIGSMKDLDGATLDDLKRFFAEFYHPGNASIVLAGDFDPAEAKGWIAKYFGPLKAGERTARAAVPATKAEARKVALADKVQLPRVYWAWPTVADDHPDAPALDLLAFVLAGGEASRLHRALVRDARIASSVSADSGTKEAAGLFAIDATAADAATKLDAIEAILKSQIEAIQRDAPSKEELARALARHESSTLAMLTSPMMRASILATGLAQHDDANHYRKKYARYFAVTPDDLRRVARRHLAPEKTVLWIEPIKPGQKEGAATPAGPIATPGAAERAIIDRTPEPGVAWSEMPEPAKPRPFSPPKFAKKALKNGVQVWVAPWTTLPVVSARLIVPGGTADDPAGKSGLGSLTATMLEQGTATRTATELAEALDGLGASLGASIDSDHTALNLQVIARNLDPALALMGEVLASPRLDAQDFGREKALQLADLKQGPDSVPWIAARAFRLLLNGEGHAYGTPTDGYVETVETLTLDDVQRFRKDHLGPKGAILIVAGDVDPDALVARLDAALAQWGPQEGEPRPRSAARPSREPGVVYFVDKPGAVQSSLYVGRLWRDRSDESYFAAMLGNRMLGADFLSRLNKNLRVENGFTYGANSAFAFRRSGGIWYASTEVRSDATAPALKEVLKELDGLATGKTPFTAEEVATALDAEARSYPEGFESPASIVAALEEVAKFRLPDDYLGTFLEKLKGTGREGIAKAMAEVAGEPGRVVLIVGDRKAVEPKLKELGFAKVKLLTTDGRPAESSTGGR